MPLSILSLVSFLLVNPAHSCSQADPVPRPELWISGWNSDNVVRCDWNSRDCVEVLSSGSGGLRRPHHFSFGPDGDFYVASWDTSSIKRYDGQTFAYIGDFVAPFDGGVSAMQFAFWGPDGQLYGAGDLSHNIARFDGSTGAFIDQFIPPGGHGISGPEFMRFGPEGFLYLVDNGNSGIRRFDIQTGALIDIFVQDGSGGADYAHFFDWGPDGNLYVTSSANNRVLRYDGRTGAYIDEFVVGRGLNWPCGIAFGPDGHLYVASLNNNTVIRFDGQTGDRIDIFLRGASSGFTGPVFIEFMPQPELKMLGPEPGVAGATNTLTTYLGTPGEFALFAYGLDSGRTELPFGRDAFLYIEGPMVGGLTRVDAEGRASMRLGVDASLSGSALYFQAAELTSGRTSELRRFVFP